MYALFGKRSLDLCLSIFLLIVLSPLFLILTVIVWLSDGKNPFFVQKRPGRNDKLFSILKFRTMINALEPEGNLLPDEVRITPLGRILRKTSLDELPQLVNILTGEMSFVGPRPLLPEYLPLYTPIQRRRHLVLPGLTGLAQVRGRNLLRWHEKLELDVRYVDTLSLRLDLTIMCQSLFIVLTQKGTTPSNNDQAASLRS
jgi:undecaprenyl phosphate N,N'-diacetylbacillosamine 1-phosphate transferase